MGMSTATGHQHVRVQFPAPLQEHVACVGACELFQFNTHAMA